MSVMSGLGTSTTRGVHACKRFNTYLLNYRTCLWVCRTETVVYDGRTIVLRCRLATSALVPRRRLFVTAAKRCQVALVKLWDDTQGPPNITSEDGNAARRFCFASRTERRAALTRTEVSGGGLWWLATAWWYCDRQPVSGMSQWNARRDLWCINI